MKQKTKWVLSPFDPKNPPEEISEKIFIFASEKEAIDFKMKHELFHYFISEGEEVDE